MLKIKALKAFIGTDGVIVSPGAAVELDNGLAKNLILRGRAELYTEPQPPKGPSKSKTTLHSSPKKQTAGKMPQEPIPPRDSAGA